MKVWEIVGRNPYMLAEFLVAQENGAVAATLKRFVPGINEKDVWESLKNSHDERYNIFLKQVLKETEE